MWLLSSLLALVLCLKPSQAFQCSTTPYDKKVPEYIACPDSRTQTNKSGDVQEYSECEYPSTVQLVPCDSQDDGFFCWRLLNPISGTLEVEFPLLAYHCNYTAYDVTLLVYEGTDCSVSLEEFQTHSKKEVSIKRCFISETSCTNQCNLVGSVLFHHVFSACYQLIIVPRRYYQGYQKAVTEPVYLTTNYSKTIISSSHNPLLTFSWDSDSLSIRVQFPKSLASSEIIFNHDINISKGLEACRLTGVSHSTCVICLETKEIQCTSLNSDSISPSCSYQGESVVKCIFRGLKPGNYCVRIQFDDDRCMTDTVWHDNVSYPKCTWDTPIRELLPSTAETGPAASQSTSPFLITLLVLAIFAACGLAGFILYRHRLPSYHQFLPVRHKTLQITERPVILLLYARDCPPFMQTMIHLRNLMRIIYNCQVMDCWDDSQYESVAQGPVRWVLSLLTNPKVRTVLVVSPASTVQETALLHRATVRYCQPKAFDSIFTHALANIHETAGPDAYSKVFVVKLDTSMVEGIVPVIRTHLNPLTTYVLPVHLNKLMTTLHNLDSVLSADGQSDTSVLADSISDYAHYLRDNSEYLDLLLVSEKAATTVQQMIV